MKAPPILTPCISDPSFQDLPFVAHFFSHRTFSFLFSPVLPHRVLETATYYFLLDLIFFFVDLILSVVPFWKHPGRHRTAIVPPSLAFPPRFFFYSVLPFVSSFPFHGNLLRSPSLTAASCEKAPRQSTLLIFPPVSMFLERSPRGRSRVSP